METTSQFSDTTSLVDTMASPPDFLKLEDLYSTPPPATSFDNMARQQTPPPVIVKSHPAKKRKSWGQQLPEPSTDLPPRKRAKTDDEKEQRRIERIKRNRAAAHNSRERKRQETDVLAVALARANAELDAYRKLHGPLPPSVVLPEVTLCVDDDTQTPAPSLVGSRGSVDLGASRPSSPHDTLFDYPTDIKQEKVDETPLLSSSLPAFDTNISKPTPLLLDPTQHSAVSVEQQQAGFNFDFMVGKPLPLPHDPSVPDLLQSYPGGSVDDFAFTNGAFDASFNAPLDFSFDDFIDDSATVAVDYGTGAA